MLKKIKDLMQTKESIDEINSKLDSTTTELEQLKKEIRSLSEQTIILKNNQQDLFLNFKENIDLIKNIRQDLENESYNFKLLQNHIQSRILEKFESEIKENLIKQFEKLKIDISNFNKLKDNLSIITENSEELKEQINKLLIISKNLKQQDFELNKFANKIFEADQEKLKLMKEIDALQRLVSKIRRER